MGRLLLALVLVGVIGAAWADPWLVAELEVVATRYHENPARLDAVREALLLFVMDNGPVRRPPEPARLTRAVRAGTS